MNIIPWVIENKNVIVEEILQEENEKSERIRFIKWRKVHTC